MENRHSPAAPPNAKGGSGSGCPENKDVAAPNLSSAAEEVAATVATSDDDGLCKGNKNVAADSKKLKPHIVAERKRRDRMRDYFGELLALIPQIPAKSDKGTIVGHAVDYIQSLEKTKAMLEKRKQELAHARQAAAAAEGAASSSSAPPQSVRAMAAVSSDIPQPQLLQLPLSIAVPAPPPQVPTAARRQVGFQTWSWPNLVLNVSDDKAYISVCAPRHLGMQNMVTVLSVLNKHGIDVATAQVDSDAVRSMFNIYAHVTAMDGENPSVQDVYKLAVSEILVWLNITS